MEGGEVLQTGVWLLNLPQINRFDILVTFIAEIDAIGFLSLCIEIVKRFLFFVVAERADQPIDSPLISAKGAEKIFFPISSLNRLKEGREPQIGQ